MWTALTALHFSEASGKRSVAKEDRRVCVVTGFHLHNFGLSPKFVSRFSLFLTNEQREPLPGFGEWRETAVTLTGLGEMERGETLLRQSSSSKINLTNVTQFVFTGKRGSHTASLAQVSYMSILSPQSSGKNNGCLFSPALVLVSMLRDGTNRSGSWLWHLLCYHHQLYLIGWHYLSCSSQRKSNAKEMDIHFMFI